MVGRSMIAIAMTAGSLGAGAVASAHPTSPRSHRHRAPAPSHRHRAATLSVGGAVGAPATYTRSQLAGLPQTTFTAAGAGRHHARTVSETGVSVQTLVDRSQPTLPGTHNALLRGTVTVAGRGRARATFALGELDVSFGDHPAYIALSRDGHRLPAPTLVVPGDRGPERELRAASSIMFAVHDPAPVAPPQAGGLVIQAGGRTHVLDARTLARLVPETLQVTFEAESGSQSDTEVGPSLDAVLRAAHVHETRGTWVAGVGNDGYVAVVTPGEQWFGGKRLQVSLNENGQPLRDPRLVVDGDVKGGRYVSGMEDLVVGVTPQRSRTRGRGSRW